MKYLFAMLLVFFMTSLSHSAELNIGLIPEQNVFKQMAKYEALGKYIEKKTGTKFKFTILSKYGNIVESFSRKKLDGAFWGSFTGALAIEQLNIQPMVRPVNPDGSSHYHGYILVHKNSGIKNVADMKGKTIAFVDRATTAGYIFPKAYFRGNGVENIDTYFKESYFAGSHDAAIHAVLNGKVDIACAKNTIYDLLAIDDPRIKSELVIITESTYVPSNGLGLRKEIPYGVKEDLRQALLDMHLDTEGQEVLRKYGARKFIETSEKDYLPVIELAKKAGIDIKTYEYNNK